MGAYHRTWALVASKRHTAELLEVTDCGTIAPSRFTRREELSHKNVDSHIEQLLSKSTLRKPVTVFEK
ncbi:hypothetical protein ACN38_g7727 [Penicillium nordicum]|uniref:Uncharacterized protein n=1 Tax=Penicillium nordicum TaxID=229535 RepID=A0A0M8P6I2_9EURO|nr:hypothetical protein ACN38_g7727 [Penicillium nordicum]